jgi:hypothetical protein
MNWLRKKASCEEPFYILSNIGVSTYTLPPDINMTEKLSENGCPYCFEGWGCKHEYLSLDDGYFITGYAPDAYYFLISQLEKTFHSHPIA